MSVASTRYGTIRRVTAFTTDSFEGFIRHDASLVRGVGSCSLTLRISCPSPRRRHRGPEQGVPNPAASGCDTIVAAEPAWMSALVVYSDTTAECNRVVGDRRHLGDRRDRAPVAGPDHLGHRPDRGRLSCRPRQLRHLPPPKRDAPPAVERPSTRCLPKPPTWVPGTTIPRRSCANRKATS